MGQVLYDWMDSCCSELVYSWLPGRFGLEITYLDGLVSFTDGAFIRNLGVVLLLHTAGILLALLKYLWGVIRKKSPFLWQFALLEAGIAGICLVIGIHLVKNRSVVQFEGGKAAATAAVLILAVVLLVLVILGLRAMKREKKSSGNAKTKSPAGSGATQKASAEDPIARFDQIVEEKNRLTRSGNYAAQIPLLTEATGLALDNMRMARIWNYMGLAHEGLQSPQKAEESYRTALRFDPENPSSHNNLALLYSAGRKHDLALRYMDLALAEAKKRKRILAFSTATMPSSSDGAGINPRRMTISGLQRQPAMGSRIFRPSAGSWGCPETACLRQVKQNAISVSGMPDRIWRFVAGIGVYELLDAAAEEAAAELAIMQYRSISMRMVVSMEALIMAVTPTPERASMEKSCRA
jgi:tetratricopeptide (TPR) repeat protein